MWPLRGRDRSRSAPACRLSGKGHFRDGQTIKQGISVPRSDKRPSRRHAQPRQSGAREVQRSHSPSGLARAQTVAARSTIRRAGLRSARAAYRNAQASVTANERSQAGELDLDSPTARSDHRRIGDRRVTEGNLVTGRHRPATPRCLPHVVSMDRSASSSTLDEAAYLAYERLSSGGKDVTSRERA